MLRRLLKNRQTRPDPGKDTPPSTPARAERPDAVEAPPDPVDRLLEVPEEQAAAAVAELTDAEMLISVALRARGTLRDATLEHPLLRRAASLTRLEKRSRDRNKAVNRHARTLLDRYRHLQHEADAHRTRAHELAEALERPAPEGDDPAWRERQRQLHERLTATLNAYAELRDGLAGFGDVPDSLDVLRPDPAALPPPDEPADGADRQAPGQDAAEPASAGGEDPFETLVAGFRELDAAMHGGHSFADISARRQALTDQWLTAADHQPPSEAEHEVFEAVSHRFRELADAVERLQQTPMPALPPQPLDFSEPADAAAHRAQWEAVSEHRRLLKQLERLRREVRWPDWAPPTPEYAAVIEAAGGLVDELARADEALTTELSRLEAQVGELTAAIDEGALNQAQSLLARARALHDALPDSAVRGPGKDLGRQAARLAELKDWQTFATSPKRESLVESMEALAANPHEPRDQAERIKALRREWQGLGPVTQAADGRLADRFNAAAEQAFEPCRAYFAEQAEQRKANLAERKRICDQLERYLEDTDWTHADMKGAERIMRAARDEWRRFHPVDRNPGRKVEARFETLQGRLHDLVKAEWDRNLAHKEAIVAEAEALADGDAPVQDKVSSAKALQQRWRQVGITPRRPDQRLWQAFRAACDRIFSARDESRQAADAALDELATRLANRMDELAAALDKRDHSAASPAALNAFRQQTADVDRLPPGRRKPLAERRAALIRDYQSLLDAQRRAQAGEALRALARWDEAATAAELEAEGREAALPDPPAEASGVREARLAAAGAEPPRDTARRLVVRAELLAGLDSPAEDESLRLEVQVERLQAGLSGGGADEDARSLAEAWCRLGPKDADFTPWRERLFAAITHLD